MIREIQSDFCADCARVLLYSHSQLPHTLQGMEMAPVSLDLQNRVDRALSRVAAEVRLLASVSPENASSERARLVNAATAGKRELPRWNYGASTLDSHTIHSLAGIAKSVIRWLPNTLVKLYYARIEELDLEARIALSAGRPAFGKLARTRFGAGAGTSLERARKWLALPPAEECGEVILSDSPHPGSLLSLMKSRVSELSLDFDVVVHPSLMSLAATGEKTIYVAAARPATKLVGMRTVLHETLAHALPRQRARKASLGIFRTGTARGHDDQEGLALWIEAERGMLDVERKREIGARHVAVHAMRNGADFVEVVDQLREFSLANESAILIAERVFRGSSNGRNEGLGREAVYLPAYLRVSRAIAANADALRILSSGQVATAAVKSLAPYAVHY